MRRSVVWAAGVLCFLTSATARGALITFDEQPNGKVINTQYLSKYGLTISADNFTPNHPDLSITFDTNLKKTNDTDLQQPWTGGATRRARTITRS